MSHLGANDSPITAEDYLSIDEELAPYDIQKQASTTSENETQNLELLEQESDEEDEEAPVVVPEKPDVLAAINLLYQLNFATDIPEEFGQHLGKVNSAYKSYVASRMVQKPITDFFRPQ